MADHHQKQHPWPSSSPRPQQRQDGKILLHPVTSSPLATAETIYSHHSTSQDYNHVGDYEDAEEEDSDCISEEEDEEQDQEEEPWMEWFLKLPGHHLYLRVPEDYLRDDFNLTDLSSKVPYYKAALAMLLHDPISNTLKCYT